jgi:subtilase family serine protease
VTQIVERAATTANNGVWEPFLRVAADDSVQVYYASETDASNQQIVVQSSTDQGATWGSATVVSSSTGSRDGMPGVTKLNGKIL